MCMRDSCYCRPILDQEIEDYSYCTQSEELDNQATDGVHRSSGTCVVRRQRRQREMETVSFKNKDTHNMLGGAGSRQYKFLLSLASIWLNESICNNEQKWMRALEKSHKQSASRSIHQYVQRSWGIDTGQESLYSMKQLPNVGCPRLSCYQTQSITKASILSQT